MTARRAYGALALIISVMFAACNETMTEVKLEGSGWTLVSVRRKPVFPSGPLSVFFGPTGVSGYGGCNFFGAAYHTSGSAVRFESIQINDPGACSHVEQRTQESEFFIALGAARSYQVYADRLELLDEGGQLILRFSRGFQE